MISQIWRPSTTRAKSKKSAYILEKESYILYIGKSVRDIKELEYKYVINETTVIKKLTSHYRELIAGNDIRMPFRAKSDLAEALKEGKVNRNQLAQSVKRLLSLILEM